MDEIHKIHASWLAKEKEMEAKLNAVAGERDELKRQVENNHAMAYDSLMRFNAEMEEEEDI